MGRVLKVRIFEYNKLFLYVTPTTQAWPPSARVDLCHQPLTVEDYPANLVVRGHLIRAAVIWAPTIDWPAYAG